MTKNAWHKIVRYMLDEIETNLAWHNRCDMFGTTMTNIVVHTTNMTYIVGHTTMSDL